MQNTTKVSEVKLRADFGIKDIIEAKERISPYLESSPLIRAHTIEKYLNSKSKIYFKCENFNITKSFKIRGALNVVLKNYDLIKERGIVTRSSGNYAQSLSYVSRLLKIPATIVMPEDAPAIKVKASQEWGANIVVYGKTHKESEDKVLQFLEETNGMKGSPYDDYEMIAGSGTAVLEIFDSFKSGRVSKFKNFICPIGGGGLMAGCATAIKEFKDSSEKENSVNKIKVIGVEPEFASDFLNSLKKGERTTMDNNQVQSVPTICDGLKAPIVGERNYPLLKRYVDEVFAISDDAVKEAQEIVKEKMNLIIEPSSAIGVAKLFEMRRHLSENAEEDTIVMITGGNV